MRVCGYAARRYTNFGYLSLRFAVIRYSAEAFVSHPRRLGIGFSFTVLLMSLDIAYEVLDIWFLSYPMALGIRDLAQWWV